MSHNNTASQRSGHHPRQPLALNWVGGGDNQASNPADWSPGFAPKPGDTLSIGSGTMKVLGNALAGDRLHTLSIGGTVNIVTGPGAKLNLDEGGNVTTNISVHNTLLLNVNATGEGVLHVSGGPIRFIGNNNFNGQQTFNDRLYGTATLSLFGAQGEGDLTEINGAVGSGLTFIISGIATLQIDRPSEFHGLIDLSHRGIINDVAFIGLHATSGDLRNGILQLFDGHKLVDTTRVTGASSAQLHQTDTGVVLSAGIVPGIQPGAPVIPLNT